MQPGEILVDGGIQFGFRHFVTGQPSRPHQFFTKIPTNIALAEHLLGRFPAISHFSRDVHDAECFRERQVLPGQFHVILRP